MPELNLLFEATGTQWSIRATDIENPTGLTHHIRQEIEDFEQTYSRFRPNSTVALMANASGTYRLPDTAKQLLEIYRLAYELTDGKVTPLIGQVLSDAGYDAEYSLRPGIPVVPAAWDAVLDYQFPNLTVNRPVRLDFGAAGKGLIVDLIGTYLLSVKASSYVIDAGGDLLCFNSQLTVGLEDPSEPSQAIGSLNLRNGSLCGSSGNRRRWEGYHHLIDPQTLRSPERILAVWATAESAVVADMLTTCLFFERGKEFARLCAAEYLVLYDDYSIDQSAGFQAELYLRNDRP